MLSRARALAREAFLPPWFEERRTDQELRWFTRVRLFMIAGSIFTDVVLLGWLGDAPEVDAQVLYRFGAINISLLSLDAVLSAVFLRRMHAAAPYLEAALIVLETFTIAVWVQVTGTVSSYFIAALFVLPFAYRVMADYRVGVAAYAGVFVCHCGAFALEELGVLEPMALFAGETDAFYNAPRYRLLVMWSLANCYPGAFGIANVFVARRRRRESELREAREQLAGVAYGRLSGHAVAGGAYELGEVLGRGGMGEVYKARHRERGECAVKIIHPHLARRPSMVARFEVEAEAAARMPERLAPAFYGADFDGAERFIAMEYLQGEDLAASLRRRGRFEVDAALEVLEEIAARLDAAHEAGLVHRDLKPQNVFLLTGTSSEAVDLRLLDFGIAKLRDTDADLTRTGAVLGSPGYMAPEQAIGQSSRVGPAADTFALGAIAYELLTGQMAYPHFDGGDASDRLCRAPTRPSERRPGLSARVDRVLAKALASDPDARFARASALVDALRAAITGGEGDDGAKVTGVFQSPAELGRAETLTHTV